MDTHICLSPSNSQSMRVTRSKKPTDGSQDIIGSSIAGVSGSNADANAGGGKKKGSSGGRSRGRGRGRGETPEDGVLDEAPFHLPAPKSTLSKRKKVDKAAGPSNDELVESITNPISPSKSLPQTGLEDTPVKPPSKKPKSNISLEPPPAFNLPLEASTPGQNPSVYKGKEKETSININGIDIPIDPQLLSEQTIGMFFSKSSVNASSLVPKLNQNLPERCRT
jgi:hypothetical protein